MNKLTKQQALAKIKELEKYIEEIKEKKPKSIWDIDEDNFEEYWYCSNADTYHHNEYSDFENARIVNNAFLTEEEAIKELEKRKAIARVIEWKHKNGLDYEPDWEDNNEEKNFIVYNIRQEELTWGDTYASEYFPPTGYFKTLKDIEKCIEECKEDLELIYK